MSMGSKLENAEDMRNEGPLVGRLANGDPGAPKELVERHYAELYRQEQAAERINQGQAGANKILVRFTRP